MSIRIVPITISFFLVFGHVSALGAELPLIVMPSNMEALNVENEAAPPLPILPALPGETWRHWIVPAAVHARGTLQTITRTIVVVNIGASQVTADIECYAGRNRHSDNKSKMVTRKKYKLKEHESAYFRLTRDDFSTDWCRVSATNPIMAYQISILTEDVYEHLGSNSGIKGKPGDHTQKTRRNYTTITPGYPYPVE